MKIGIYSPYLDTSGGGERYFLTIAEILSQKEQVDILLDDHLLGLGIDSIEKKIRHLHNLDLSQVHFKKAPLKGHLTFLKKLFFLRQYDIIFYLTDGSIFFSTAKKNILHFQVPFENQTATNLWGRIKLSTWQNVIYNSKFTKDIIEQDWPVKGRVVYPPVSVEEFKPLNKKKQILSVGRFFGYTRSKKHQVMIEAFKEMSSDIKGWSLCFVGGADEGDKSYLEELKEDSKGFDISFYPNLSFDDLKKIYGQSSIYWHATGYKEKDPKMFEHFGITTVEAMAAGCVPVVINLGGQREIVQNEVSGYLWNTTAELKEFTLKLVSNTKLRERQAKEAVKGAKIFDKEHFKKQILSLVYGN